MFRRALVKQRRIDRVHLAENTNLDVLIRTLDGSGADESYLSFGCALAYHIAHMSGSMVGVALVDATQK